MNNIDHGGMDPFSVRHLVSEEGAFSREDDGNDSEFYKTDRFVSHLDSVALATVEKLIGQLVVEDGPDVLDLMASWDSHIPASVNNPKVVGLGMNERELARNEALTAYVVHDLNRDPVLPFDDNSFDVVLNTVSVDYLTQPYAVFDEVARVLRPGGLHLVIFSNRYFPKKAVKVWREAMEDERLELVEEYFAATDGFGDARVFLSMGKPRPADDKYAILGVPSDPVFAVYAEKKGEGPYLDRPEPRDDDYPIPSPEEVEARKKDIKHSRECPYCGSAMRKWKVPEDPFVEWETEHMYICFNDACPYLVRGWKAMFEQGNTSVSCRIMYNPDRDRTVPVPVHGLKDLREGIVD